MPNAVLSVGGQTLEGWKSVRVSKGVDRLSGEFELELSDKFSGRPLVYRFGSGARCTVSLDGTVAITGYIDEVSIGYDAGNHTLSVRGRDVTGDLVDCSHVGQAQESVFDGLDLLAIAQRVCRPFGIAVEAEVGVGAPFPTVKTNEGESVFAFIERLAKARQVLPVSYGDGRLVFTRAGAVYSAGTIELGGNVLSGGFQQSNAERFSSYTVKGQGMSTNYFAQNPAQSATPTHPAKQTDEEYKARQDAQIRARGVATDNTVGRYRPLVIMADQSATPEKMQAIAAWEATTRAGRSRQLSYTVTGWGPQSGGLWRINTLVHVVDPFFTIDAYFLIESVEYSQDDSGGSVSRLTLVDPRAYAPDPTQTDATGIGGGYFKQ